jgi:hypothetical protein
MQKIHKNAGILVGLFDKHHVMSTAELYSNTFTKTRFVDGLLNTGFTSC